MGTPAKVLAPREVRRLLARVGRGRCTLRNRVMVLLSFKAGLRACEIAGLEWSMVLGPGGCIGRSLLVSGTIAKNGRTRRVPLHRDLKRALQQLHCANGQPLSGAVVQSQRGGHMRARAVVNWFCDQYAAVGFEGCSSHSGRRTFLTRSARLIARAGGSLRDVQELAGHRAITTTERYIEGDRDVQRKLVAML